MGPPRTTSPPWRSSAPKAGRPGSIGPATQSTHTTGYDKRGRLTKQHTVATYYGPAIQFSKMDGEFNTVIVNAHTPIDENNLELRMGLLVQGIDYNTKTGRLLGDMWIDALQSGYFQDVAIWEHKRWQDEPMLCDGDGPISDLRRWYAQFYEPLASQLGIVRGVREPRSEIPVPSHWRIDE